MRQTFNIDEVHILTEIAGKRPCQDMCVFFFPRAWWLHIYCVCAAAEQYTIWLSMWMNYCQPFPPSSSQMQEITAKALYVLLSAERPPFTEISFFCFFAMERQESNKLFCFGTCVRTAAAAAVQEKCQLQVCYINIVENVLNRVKSSF